MTASLFTKQANGLQAWPPNRTTIAVPARSEWVEVIRNPQTGDSTILIRAEHIADDLALYIPRGGSVVIEAVQLSWLEVTR